MKNRLEKYNYLVFVIAFFIGLRVLIVESYVLKLYPSSDIHAHVKIILDSLQSGQWPGYTMYYRLIYFLSGFSNDTNTLVAVSICVLILCIAFKAVITMNIISNKKIFIGFVFTIALLFVTPIMNWWKFPDIYLGQITPNVWHSTTTIFAMPFVLLLYFYAIKSLNNFNNYKYYYIVSALVILNVLVKPSYLLAFLPAYFCLIMYKYFKKDIGLKQLSLITSSIFLPVILILTFQYFNAYGGEYKSGVNIMFAPFYAWGLYSPNICASLLLSIAFPLVFTILNLKLLKEKNLYLPWLIFIFSLIQFAMFSETGSKASALNFGWGAYMSLYILFVYCTKFLLEEKTSWKSYLCSGVFMLHLLTGAFYYYRMINGFGYH